MPSKLQTPAAVRWVSAEPLLGPIDLFGMREHHEEQPECGFWHASDCPNYCEYACGGVESGPKARPCNVGWIRDIINQCKAAGVPVFNKQLGAQHRPSSIASDVAVRMIKNSKGGDMSEWPEDLRVREWPNAESI